MATIEEALQSAITHHQSGQLGPAETIYRRILDVLPTHALSLQLLGALYLQLKRVDESISLLEQATALEPQNADALNNLGGAYQAAGRWNDSASALQRAIAIEPNRPKLHFDIGNAFKGLGQFEDAIVSFRTAIQQKPDFIQAMNNLGTTLTATGRTEAAVQAFQSALQLKPDYANAQNGIGNALLDSGNTRDALRWLKQAADLQPNEAKFQCNLGVALKATGDLEGAFKAYQRALSLQPGMVEARKNLGNLFLSQQQPLDAVREFQAAAELSPGDFELLVSIGDAYRDLEDFDRAREAYRKAVDLKPEDTWLKLKEAFLWPSVATSREQSAERRKLLMEHLAAIIPAPLAPKDVEAKGLMPPFALAYHGVDDLDLRRSIAELYKDSFAADRGTTSSSVSEKPKIGFLVTNGHEGIFVRCMAGLIDRLDRDAFEVWIIAPAAATNTIRMALTNPETRFLELPDRFHRMIRPVSDLQLDLLYFWECGTDLFNYFLPFLRLARVQCTGWGLPVTSGIPAMDFYLSNRFVESPDADRHYSETLIRAETFLTWQEPINLSGRHTTQADHRLRDDQHLYVCAQNLRKIHPDFDVIIAGILRSDHEGVVVMVEDRNERLREVLERRFSASMPDVKDRVQFRPKMEFDTYLSLIQAADVALDPLHYGSGITAYEIFSCGTPLITLPTEFRRGRFVAACYAKMGITSCTAGDVEEYIQMAVNTATTHSVRSSISADIRGRCEMLFREKEAVVEFERAVRQMLGH